MHIRETGVGQTGQVGQEYADGDGGGGTNIDADRRWKPLERGRKDIKIKSKTILYRKNNRKDNR